MGRLFLTFLLFFSSFFFFFWGGGGGSFFVCFVLLWSSRLSFVPVLASLANKLYAVMLIIVSSV